MSKESDLNHLLERAAAGFDPTDVDAADALLDVKRRAVHLRARGERALRSSTQAAAQRRTSRGRRAVTALVAAASFVAGGLAVAQTDPGSEEEVAARHGLQSRPLAEGAVGEVDADGTFVIGGTAIPECSPQDHPGKAIALQEVGDHYYCIVADSEVDAWVIGQQLLGRSPTQEEISEQAKNFEEG